VKVKATREPSGRPCWPSISRRYRSVRTRVLPQPAPALRATLAFATSRASCCSRVSGGAETWASFMTQAPEQPPRNHPMSFSSSSRPLPCLTHFDDGVIECSIEDHLLRYAVYRPDEPGEFGRSTENRNSSRIPPSENPRQRRHPEYARRRPGREPRAHP